MKTPSLIFLTILLGYAGCCTTNNHSLQNLDARFRQRLAEVQEFRQASARIREVRFSSDRKSVLVIVDLPADSKQSQEFVLKDDGFQRYQGEWWQRSEGGRAVFGKIPITVDLATK